MLKILLTNDDGVRAEGLQTLAKALASSFEVRVVAPDRNRSGNSHALTLNRPVHVHWDDAGVVAVEGTPADCVYMGLTALSGFRPDLVISGINHGANLGDDTLYSGTVAAAREAALSGVPALAVSLESPFRSFEGAVAMVLQWLEGYQAAATPEVFCLNMNVPDRPLDAIKGFRLAPLGRRHRVSEIHEANHPRRRDAYWIGLPGDPHDEAVPGSDFLVVREGYVALTPLKWDETDRASMPQWGFLEAGDA